MCSLVGVTDVANMCRAVYFPTEDVSECMFVVVNALLYNLFMEQCSMTTDRALREEYLAHFHLCRANLETTLANLPMLLSPRIENVQALLLGVRYTPIILFGFLFLTFVVQRGCIVLMYLDQRLLGISPRLAPSFASPQDFIVPRLSKTILLTLLA